MGKLQPGGPDDDHQAELRRVIGEIAHELSRPLAAVLNYAELALLDPDLSESTRARLGKVLEHAEACRQVVFHSLEIHAATPRSFGPVDLNAAVRRAAASLPQAVGREDSPLVLNLHPALARVEGSARDLEAAVRNLLENALEAADAAPPGGPPPRVEVTTAPTKTGVRLTVRDNGPGLDPRIADHVFEPFVSTKDTDQATGLGLSIVRRIILDHRGQVTAGSAPEGGAVFTVDLPAREDMPGGPTAAEGGSGPANRAVDAAPARALLIDDDTAMRELLAAYLQMLGYESAQVGDGEEGLREALAGEYAAIICDVKMPAMDGLEFHRRLAAASPERALRVIFSTGVLASDPADAELRSLPNARLRKPYRLAALKTALAAVEGRG